MLEKGIKRGRKGVRTERWDEKSHTRKDVGGKGIHNKAEREKSRKERII